jgi:flagellar biosynthetic protein FlhB
MAEESGQDKTEDPTGKRLSESRKKGQVPRSRELNTFVALIVSATMFFYFGRQMTQQLLELMQHSFRVTRDSIFDPAAPVIFFKQALMKGLDVVWPLAFILLLADLLTPLLMGGWNYTNEGFALKFSKLNPLSGLKRIFGIQGIMELVKALIKVVLVGFVAWTLFKLHFQEFMSLDHLDVEQAIYRAGTILVQCLLVLSATFLLLVLIDVPYQLWNDQRQLKMTKQEVRDEAKEQEGNPEVKNKIRRMQMQAAQRRMMEAVPSADVIVTNPTHFAVALKYEQTASGAPTLVAKGTDLVAAQIRNIALANHVTLVASPSLARALYYSTELNQEIPRGLFLAVAQVLAYVFQLRAAVENGWDKPSPPTDVQVPDDFRQ